MATLLKNLSDYNANAVPNGENYSIGIVVAEWNPEVTNALLRGAVETLLKHGVEEDEIYIKRVPGTFELTQGANLLINNYLVDAVIVLGCVIQGETRHFDFICQGVTQGITQLNLDGEVPVIFGVLTTDNQEQALERAGGKHGNKGVEGAITALKMAALAEDIIDEDDMHDFWGNDDDDDFFDDDPTDDDPTDDDPTDDGPRPRMVVK